MNAKDIVSIRSPFRYSNDISCIQTVYQTPIVLRNHAEKCSLNCALNFLYPNITRHLSVKQRMMNGNRPMMYFDVHSEDKERTMSNADLVLNNEKFYLRRIELYHRSLHRVGVNCPSANDDDDEEAQKKCNEESHTNPMEMVLYHQSFTNEKRIVAVSVFMYPMESYSLSQDMFAKFTEACQGLSEDMILDHKESDIRNSLFDAHENSTIEDTEIIDIRSMKGKLGDSTAHVFFSNDFYYVGTLEFPEYFPENTTSTTSTSTSTSTTSSASSASSANTTAAPEIYDDDTLRKYSKKTVCLKYTDENRHLYQKSTKSTSTSNSVTVRTPKTYRKLFLEQTWNPMNLFPNRKSFFMYQGSFPYSGCHPHHLSDPSSDITWVIMENSMPIHEDDYQFLSSFLSDFAGNQGEKYPLYPLNSPYLDPETVHRKLYYNDGSYVRGNNAETDRFVIKCTKREQKPTFSKMYFDKSKNSSSSSSSSSKVRGSKTNKKELSEYRQQRILYDPDANNSLLMMLLWIFSVIILLSVLYYMMSVSTDRMIMTGFCVICLFIYYFSNWRKFGLLMSTVLHTLFLILYYFALKYVMKWRTTAKSEFSRGLYLCLQVILIIFIVFSIIGILMSSGSIFDTYRRTTQYYHLPKNISSNDVAEKYMISKTAPKLNVDIGSHTLEYGLPEMHEIDFRKFKIEPKEEIKEYTKNRAKFYEDILKEYDYQMKHSIHTPWESFQRAVMKYAKFGKKYYYVNAPETGLRLTFKNISEILRNELPETSAYLIHTE